MAKPRLAVVVTRASKEVDACLNSLTKSDLSTVDPTFFFVTDSTEEGLSQKHPKFEIVISEKRSVAGLYNTGLLEVLNRQFENILLLQSDVVFEPDSIREMINFYLGRRRQVVVGPVARVKIGYEVFYLVGGNLNPITGHVVESRVGLIENKPPRKVSYIPSRSLLASSKLFSKVRFDEDFVNGYEDVDFGVEAGKKDFPSFIVQTALVEKDTVNASTKMAPREIYFLIRNRLKFVYKHILFPRNLLGYLYIIGVSAKLASRSPAYLSATTHAWSDFLRGKFSL